MLVRRWSISTPVQLRAVRGFHLCLYSFRQTLSRFRKFGIPPLRTRVALRGLVPRIPITLQSTSSHCFSTTSERPYPCLPFSMQCPNVICHYCYFPVTCLSSLCHSLITFPLLSRSAFLLRFLAFFFFFQQFSLPLFFSSACLVSRRKGEAVPSRVDRPIHLIEYVAYSRGQAYLLCKPWCVSRCGVPSGKTRRP